MFVNAFVRPAHITFQYGLGILVLLAEVSFVTSLFAVSSAVPSEKSVLVGVLPTLIKKAKGCSEV